MGRPTIPRGAHGKIRYRRLKSGKYEARTTTNHNGKNYEVQATANTKAAAGRQLEERLANGWRPPRSVSTACAGLPVLKDSQRLPQLAELFFDEFSLLVKEERRSANTLASYRCTWRCQIAPVLGDLQIREILTPECQAMVDHVRTAVSVTRAKHARAVLHGIMQIATGLGLIDINPVTGVRRLDGGRKKKPRAITLEEYHALRTALGANKRAVVLRLPLLTWFLVGTGCRIGEALGVSWDDIDLSAGTVAIRWHVYKRTGEGVVREPSTKTGEDGERLLILPARLLDELKSLKMALSMQTLTCKAKKPSPLGKCRQPDCLSGVVYAVDALNGECDVCGTSVGCPLFPDPWNAGWLIPNKFYECWSPIAKTIAPDLVSHCCRKGAALIMEQGGMSTRAVASVLGHDMATTERFYMDTRKPDAEGAKILTAAGL